MYIVFSLAIYFIIWWVVLFAVLPFGVRTQAEAGHVVPGTPESAPADFRLGTVLAITTVAAGVVFAVLWAAVRWRIIDLSGVVATGS